jgi:hypothetical protein
MTNHKWLLVALAACSCSSDDGDDDTEHDAPNIVAPNAGASGGTGSAATGGGAATAGQPAIAGSAATTAGTSAAGNSGGSAATAGTSAAGHGGMAGAATAGTAAPAPSGALAGMCPDGFTPKEGSNDFPTRDGMRRFHVSKAALGEGPRPLFVALTGTVQEELAFVAQSGLGTLPASGWIVVSPVRSCSQQARNCSTVGSDGRVWEPWFDGTAPRSDQAGPDVEFVEAMVRCVAMGWPVAADKIYLGGVSAGGSFTNRNMTFNSKLFAGGVPASGNWTYGVPPATTMTMDSSIVIILWGGPSDTWPGSPPYAAETKAAAEYYAAQSAVVTVSCSGTYGHQWPAAMTPWLAETLLSHPKGTAPTAFMLKPPPAGFTCVVGPYTDH